MSKLCLKKPSFVAINVYRRLYFFKKRDILAEFRIFANFRKANN